jgi:short-subunit dehydrogenase
MLNIMITGASSGLGAELACAYAAPGTNLILYGRDEQRLNDTAVVCRRRGAVVEVACLDIRNIESLIAHIRDLDKRMPLDLAIFNAGVGGIAPIDRVSELPERSYETALVNFASPVVGATVVGELMGGRGRGRIVLIGSLAGSFPLPMAPTYAGTKAGLAMFAESLELRLTKHGVGVTLVSPGFIDTPMSRSVPPPKPFMMTAPAAAAIIRRKVASGSRRLVVPWQFSIILALARWLPRPITRAVLRRV